jgi:hypothetical protein
MHTDSKASLHEDLQREEEVIGSSDRSFGITFGVIFALIAAVKLWLGSAGTIYWLLAALVTFALAFFWNAPLRPLNRLWFRLALVLHVVVTPIMMGLLFYLMVVPIGLLMRVLGKDPLRLRRDPQVESYWIARTEDGTAPERMKNQF